MEVHSLPLVLSSDPALGATNVSSDGSSFSVILDRPIIIPAHAKQCYVEVDQATIWNNTPNIVEGVNNTLTLNIPGANSTDPVQINPLISIPTGLYDLDSLSAEISRQLENLQDGDVYDNLFELIGNISTGHIIMHFVRGGSVTFNGVDDIRQVLGFTAASVGDIDLIAEQYVTAPLEAQFNTIEYYLLHCDLVSRGIRINATYSNVVDQVFVEAGVGEQIQSRPWHPLRVPANELIGTNRKSFVVSLTDQNNVLVDTRSETYSLRLTIYYTTKIL